MGKGRKYLAYWAIVLSLWVATPDAEALTCRQAWYALTGRLTGQTVHSVFQELDPVFPAWGGGTAREILWDWISSQSPRKRALVKRRLAQEGRHWLHEIPVNGEESARALIRALETLDKDGQGALYHAFHVENRTLDRLLQALGYVTPEVARLLEKDIQRWARSLTPWELGITLRALAQSQDRSIVIRDAAGLRHLQEALTDSRFGLGQAFALRNRSLSGLLEEKGILAEEAPAALSREIEAWARTLTPEMLDWVMRYLDWYPKENGTVRVRDGATAGALRKALEYTYSFLYHYPQSTHARLFDIHFGLATHPELRRYPEKVREAAIPAIAAAAEPYSLLHSLGSPKDPPGLRGAPAILSFEALLGSKGSTNDRAKAFNAWVTSPERAVYLYTNRERLGRDGNAILSYLIRENQHFRDAKPNRGPPGELVTLSFELESRSPLVSLLYKDPKYSDAEWLALPEKERMEILEKITSPYARQRLPASLLAPTELAPTYLGSLVKETDPGLQEMTHHSFEVSPARVIGQLRELQKTFKKDNFHVHVVTALPRDYDKMPEFSLWLHQLNTYLYLKGLEEGLHPAKYIKIARRPPPPGSQVDPSRGDLPNDIGQVEYGNFKFVSAAPRATLYGRSADPRYRRLGVELRDVSRDMDLWEAVVKRVHGSMGDKIWEGRTYTAQPADREFVLDPTTVGEVARLTDLGIDPAMARRLVEAEPTVTLPLLAFEAKEYFDYRTKSFRKPTAGEKERITAARNAYLKALKDTIDSTRNYEASTGPVDAEDIQIAVRQDITTWAKTARVASLLEGY